MNEINNPINELKVLYAHLNEKATSLPIPRSISEFHLDKVFINKIGLVFNQLPNWYQQILELGDIQYEYSPEKSAKEGYLGYWM